MTCPIGRGDLAGYSARGCRCEDCTEAARVQQADYVKRRYVAGRPANATEDEAETARSQIRTLVNLGWSQGQIADAAGLRGPTISRLGSGARSTRPRYATTAAIQRAYDTLTSRHHGYQRTARAGIGTLWMPAPEHGTTARYRRGCRCRDCRAAHSLYRRELRSRKKTT